MKKDDDGFIRRSNDEDIEPDVRATISRGREVQARQKLPTQKRTRAARQAEIDRNRNRRNIDIDETLEEPIERMAAELGISFSNLLNRLAWEGLQNLSIDDLIPELQPSRSMRFVNTLSLPKKPRKGR